MTPSRRSRRICPLARLPATDTTCNLDSLAAFFLPGPLCLRSLGSRRLRGELRRTEHWLGRWITYAALPRPMLLLVAPVVLAPGLRAAMPPAGATATLFPSLLAAPAAAVNVSAIAASAHHEPRLTSPAVRRPHHTSLAPSRHRTPPWRLSGSGHGALVVARSPCSVGLVPGPQEPGCPSHLEKLRRLPELFFFPPARRIPRANASTNAPPKTSRASRG